MNIKILYVFYEQPEAAQMNAELITYRNYVNI